MNDRYHRDFGPEIAGSEITLVGRALVVALSYQISQWHGVRPRIIESYPDKLDGLVNQEKASLREAYEVMCRWVIDPLPWEFFEQSFDR